jgi:hypothetical protein
VAEMEGHGEEAEEWQAGSCCLILYLRGHASSFPPSSVWSHYMRDQVSAVPDFCTQPSRGLSAFPSLPDELTMLCMKHRLSTFKGFFFLTEENIHIHFVKEYIGSLLLSLLFCYFSVGFTLPRGMYFPRLIMKTPQFYTSTIVHVRGIKC